MRKGTKHITNYRGNPEERFWAKVVKTNDCWNWVGAKNYKGYGAFRIDGKNVFPHRFSYQIHLNNIPEGLFVCHSCDNPSCVNPKHLWLGTNKDNVKDMVLKLRNTLGERNGMVKLTEDKVRNIRSMKGVYTLNELAEMYGIAISTVSQIINRRRWKHI